MNAKEYQQISNHHFGVYEGNSIRVAARKVNLTIQSVLQQEQLLLRQLHSIDQEEQLEQQVVIPITY